MGYASIGYASGSHLVVGHEHEVSSEIIAFRRFDYRYDLSFVSILLSFHNRILLSYHVVPYRKSVQHQRLSSWCDR